MQNRYTIDSRTICSDVSGFLSISRFEFGICLKSTQNFQLIIILSRD